MEGKFYANDGTQWTLLVSQNLSAIQLDIITIPVFRYQGPTFMVSLRTDASQLSKFSVAAWFKTSADYSSNAFIVNKGGLSFEDPGANLNYGIFMNSEEQIRGGFETRQRGK